MQNNVVPLSLGLLTRGSPGHLLFPAKITYETHQGVFLNERTTYSGGRRDCISFLKNSTFVFPVLVSL